MVGCRSHHHMRPSAAEARFGPRRADEVLQAAFDQDYHDAACVQLLASDSGFWAVRVRRSRT